MGLAPDIDSRKECSLGIRGGDLRTDMATLGNPQQVARQSRDDTRIGRGARDTESHYTGSACGVANPLPFVEGENRPAC